MDLLAACGGQTPTNPTPTSISGGSINVGLGATRSIAPYYLGYNAEAINSPSWHDTQFSQACTKMKPAVLRYPGGTIANYWDWQTGLFLNNRFPNTPVSVYRLQELQIAVQATGATPSYVLNMLTSDLSYQMEMLRTASSMGLPVKLIELGNEFDLSQADVVNAFPNGEDYGRIASQWITAIRAEFPDARIAGLGAVADPAQGASSREKNWNQQVVQTLQGADALVFHPYVIPNFVKNVGQTVEFNAVTDDSGRNKVFGYIYDKLNLLQGHFQSIPGNLNAWFTEYNLNDKVGALRGTWLHGIFAATMTLAYLDQLRTEWVGYYDMIGDRGFNVIFPNSQGFKGIAGAASIQTTPFALTAPGWTMQLLSETMYHATSAQKLSFSPEPSLSSDNGVSFPALLGWIFAGDAGKAAYIVNCTSASYTLKIQSAFSQAAHNTQLTTDPLSRIAGPQSISPSTGSVQGQVRVPAYSVTQLV